MAWTDLLPLVPVVIMPTIMVFTIFETPSTLFKRYVLGRPAVKVTNRENGKKWLTPVEICGEGQLRGWRYPTSKNGVIYLNEVEKTGQYYGTPLTWEWL